MGRKAPNDELEIRHDQQEHRFVAKVAGEKKESVLDYERLDDTTLEYRHTFVPEELRKRGIASRLTRHALDWAADNDHAVVPSCPFVRSYVEKHPEIAGVVAPQRS